MRAILIAAVFVAVMAGAAHAQTTIDNSGMSSYVPVEQVGTASSGTSSYVVVDDLGTSNAGMVAYVVLQEIPATKRSRGIIIN